MALASVIIFGLIIGSFLNVAIHRVPRKMSVSHPARSICPNCERQLTCWENIPVLSWILLFGKCKGCKAPISGRYPLVEILSGIAAAACYIRFGLNPTGILLYIFTVTLIVTTFIDFEFRIIPNVISFPGMTIGLVLGIVSQYTGIFELPITQSALQSLLGFLCGGGFFWAIGEVYYRLYGRVGLGGGDIKLTAMIGAILGVKAIIPTIFAGSLVGAVVGVAMMLLQGTGRKTEIAFGPWLATGALLFIFADIEIFRLRMY